MPYEYRTLSKEERAALVETRRQRGYPLHDPPHPIRAAGWYLLTAANYEHRPLMASPERRDAFQAALLSHFEEIEAEVGAWVVLPNHYHILAGVHSLDQVSGALKLLHGRTAFAWNREDGLTGQRRVWYKFADRWIRNGRHYYRALNYIHYNPVKHGYVDDAYGWTWSSVHWYLEENGRDWLRQTWRSYPVEAMGMNWDDC